MCIVCYVFCVRALGEPDFVVLCDRLCVRAYIV